MQYGTCRPSCQGAAAWFPQINNPLRHEARGELEVSTHYHGAFEVSIAADTRRHGSSLVKRCRANTERGESVLWTRRTKLAADPNKHQRCWSKSSNLSVVPENGRDPPPLIISLTAMLC